MRVREQVNPGRTAEAAEVHRPGVPRHPAAGVREAIGKHVAERGTTSLAEDIPITDVSRWLGRKSIEVTRQIYGHLVHISFDCARSALNAAYQRSRKQQRPRKRC